MDPNKSNDFELVGIEVGGDDPVHLDGRVPNDGKDFDIDHEGFDVGVDMRNLDGDEGATNGGPEGDGPDIDTEGDEEEETEGEEPKEEGEALEDLGDFDAQNPEVVEKFASRYFPDGTLSLQTLYSEFEANFAKDNARLNAGTEEFLASRGIPKQALEDNYEAYKIRVEEAKRTAKEHDEALTTLAGGKESYRAAIQWAKSSGAYSEAAIKSYNAIMNGSDLQAKQDAVELLMVRFNKANQAAPRDEPRRDATKGRAKANTSGLKPFANRSEYAKAVKDAGNDMRKLREIDARARLGGF